MLLSVVSESAHATETEISFSFQGVYVGGRSKKVFLILIGRKMKRRLLPAVLACYC